MNSKCQSNTKCISKPDATFECVCLICTDYNNYSPICASNGLTYLSKCHLKYYNCIHGKDIQMMDLAACGEQYCL